MQRMGVQPRDHMKENYRMLKQTQLKNREDKEEAARPADELYKRPQFKEVQSRVYEESEDSPRRGNNDFLTKGASEKRRMDQAYNGRLARAEVERKLRDAAELATKPPSPRKASVPRAEDINDVAPRHHENFIQRNKMKALSMQPPDKHDEDQISRHREFGRVPEYLEERKAQWQEAEVERKKRLPDPSCPPGMCVMPEDERVATLETLQQSRRECMNQLQRMPFVIETPSLKKKQQDLEMKMREIDNAIGIFSKSKVYVAIR
jgi:hypothetical protein